MRNHKRSQGRQRIKEMKCCGAKIITQTSYRKVEVMVAAYDDECTLKVNVKIKEITNI